MSIHLHMFRHVESRSNLKPELILGRSPEAPVSDNGGIQAIRLAQYVSREGLIPEYVFASPAVRTRYTAEEVLGHMNLAATPEIIFDDRLLEMSHGSWEGQAKDKVYTEDVKREIERAGKDFALPGGESMNNVSSRVNSWFEESVVYLDKRNKNVVVFAFTHGAAVGCLASKLSGWSQQRTLQEIRRPIPNASDSLFVYENKKLKPVYLGLDTQNDNLV